MPKLHQILSDFQNFLTAGIRGLTYKISNDKYTTMLWHVEGLQQMYNETRFTKNRTTKLEHKLRQSYDKMYDSSLDVIQQHQARMQ